jgi:hypothetical protein
MSHPFRFPAWNTTIVPKANSREMRLRIGGLGRWLGIGSESPFKGVLIG